MEIAFKPVAKRGPVKTVVWVEDIHWNSKSDCITEPFMVIVISFVFLVVVNLLKIY